MEYNNFMRSKDIYVDLGNTMIIDVNTVTIKDYASYILVIGTAFPKIVGTEAVQLKIGCNVYPLIDNAGNIVVSGKMRDGKLICCGNIQCAKYRLQFGANGMPCGVPHFVCHEGLCPMRYNGPLTQFPQQSDSPEQP